MTNQAQETMTKARLLYVEDDETLSFVTKDHLEMQGYDVTHCPDGLTAKEVVENNEFDLCILDVMLPHIDGFTLAENIRKQNRDIPILFLTAKSMKEDRLEGFKLGGDDYVTKPFSVEELVMRIEVFLRRSKVESAEAPVQFEIGHFTFDYPNLELTSPDDKATLTQKEADLLRFICQRPNQVIKRSDILIEVWGKDDYFLGRSLDVFISRLRKYLKSDPSLKIENLHGVGFRFQV